MSDGTPILHSSPFDGIRRSRPDGSEFWSARELQPLMGYAEWRNLQTAIERARAAIRNTEGKSALTSHVVDANTIVARPQGGSIRKADFELSRYAAYLTAINGDPEKPETAAAQAYFAIKTREAELTIQKPSVAVQLPQGNSSEDRAIRRLAVLNAARGLVDPKHLEAKARIQLAHGLGETPEIPQEILPLYAQTYLEEKGMSRSDIKSHASNFGKRVKAAYMLLHDKEPMKYPLETANGQVRSVYAYTENDRHIMDSVWSLHYQ